MSVNSLTVIAQDDEQTAEQELHATLQRLLTFQREMIDSQNVVFTQPSNDILRKAADLAVAHDQTLYVVTPTRCGLIHFAEWENGLLIVHVNEEDWPE